MEFKLKKNVVEIVQMIGTIYATSDNSVFLSLSNLTSNNNETKKNYISHSNV